MSRAKSIAIALVGLVTVGLIFFLLNQQQGDKSGGPSQIATEERNPAKLAGAAKSDVISTVSSTPTFVGRDTCKDCHAENHRLHGSSGHASTFAKAGDSVIVKKLVGQTFDAGEPYGSFTYALEQGSLLARLPDRFGNDPFPLQFALGSGHNAITLLTLLPDEEEGTIGIEHRVSWYGTDDTLDITPGQVGKVPEIGPEFFGTTFRGQTLDACVSCHVTSGKIVGQEIVDLIPNVNCERCHGPASEHVRQARASATPPPFAVGRADWTTESELRLCGSCHRMPSDLSKKDLRDYPKRVVKFQPVGLLRSRCFLESEGRMKCTTCHNPHMRVGAKTKQAYQQDCISCHGVDSQHQVACPVSPRQRCIECHMPQFKFERDITFHDHWIRVPPDG